MKYIFVLIVSVGAISFAMEQNIDPRISSPATLRAKSCWKTLGAEIIMNNDYCQRKEEFSKIVTDCSCEVLYDLLYCAVKLPHGAPYVRELLQRKDCCPCGRETDPNTPLCVAIAGNGSLDTIQFLMHEGGSIVHNKATDVPEISFTTPLQAAAYYGRTDVLQALLKEKKPIDIRTIRLIQKKYDALTKLAQLSRHSSHEDLASLKTIEAAHYEWGTIRKAVTKHIREEAQSLSEKSSK